MIGHFGREVYISESRDSKTRYGIIIQEFDDGEFSLAWQKYKERFGFIGDPSENIKKLCCEPFMMGLIAEIYIGEQIPEYIEHLEVYTRYFDKKFPSENRHNDVKRFLYSIVKQILKEENPHISYSATYGHDIIICDILLNENILIIRNDRLIFRTELLLEYIAAQYITTNLVDTINIMDFPASNIFTTLIKSKLINMPGIIENVLLMYQNQSLILKQCLSRLCDIEVKWQLVAISVMKKIKLPLLDLSDIIYQLSCSKEYIVRLFLSQSLTNFINNNGWEFIFKLASDEEHWAARETAANILRFEVSSEANLLETLIKLMGDYHWRVRRAAGHSFNKLFRRNNENDKIFIDKILDDICEMDWKVKYSFCIGLLGASIDDNSLPSHILRTLSKDLNPQVRWAIANYLPRYQGHNLFNIARQLFNDSNDWIRGKTIGSIIDIINSGNEELIDILENRADNESSYVKIAMARNIGNIDKTELIREVLEPFLSEKFIVAFAAAYTLRMKGVINDINKVFPNISSELLILYDYREKVSRKDNGSTVPIDLKEFISKNVFFPEQYDSYMKTIETMCGTISIVREDKRINPVYFDHFLRMLSNDPDEAVRWALVMYLTNYSEMVIHQNVMMNIMDLLKTDNHFWVRREVAIALGIIAEKYDNLNKIANMLIEMETSEIENDDACKDEVLYFIKQSLRKL